MPQSVSSELCLALAKNNMEAAIMNDKTEVVLPMKDGD